VREVLGAESKPLWLSFTLADEGAPASAPLLRSGERAAEAVASAVRLGAAAVLFNCSRPEVMGAAITEAAQVLAGQDQGAERILIGVYANAFVPLAALTEANEALSELRVDVSPAVYLQWAKDWVERGAQIIGGCCGIGPEHIAELGKLNAS
jgi:homocysteine S-methyltransferase